MGLYVSVALAVLAAIIAYSWLIEKEGEADGCDYKQGESDSEEGR